MSTFRTVSTFKQINFCIYPIKNTLFVELMFALIQNNKPKIIKIAIQLLFLFLNTFQTFASLSLRITGYFKIFKTNCANWVTIIIIFKDFEVFFHKLFTFLFWIFDCHFILSFLFNLLSDCLLLTKIPD